MRVFIRMTAAILLVLGGVQTASAEAEAGQGYLSAMGTYSDYDRGRGVDDGISGRQFGIGYAINENYNIGALVSLASPDYIAFSAVDQDLFGVGIDLQRVFRRAERFSPYLHAGLGYFKTDQPGIPADAEGAMYSFGAGFLLDLFSSDIALRGEYRYRVDNALSDDTGDDLFSLGLQIPFGRTTPTRAEPVAVVDGDSDGDGVRDSMDECPGTPRGVAVSANGCPKDSDGDGVSDDRDECPGTPAGEAVDARGCELDDDGDGVVNRLDECPGTTAGAQVDIKGCEIKEEIRLEGVNFETNSDRLLPGAASILDDAAATLRKNETIEVEVAGHTDSDGAADYNEGLSARRAQTVHDYLAANGVSVDRMTVRGYGEAQPVADNTTATGKATNRRVVLRITAR